MFNLLGSLQRNFSSDSESDAATTANATAQRAERSRIDDISANASLFAGKLAGYARIASSVAQERASRISSILNENTLIGELERENESFKEQLQGEKRTLEAEKVPLPWEGMPNVDVTRKHILALSLDERNFLAEAPPDEIAETYQKAVAQKLLSIDSRLGQMRYKLVPKKISEEGFWKNYFYRISLLKKLIMEKQKDADNIPKVRPSSSSQGENKEQAEASDKCETKLTEANVTESHTDNENSSSSPPVEEDWEKELLNDISEFELLENGQQKSDAEWDEEIKAIIEAEALSEDKEKKK